MLKYVTFPGQDEAGSPLVEAIVPTAEGSLVKTASSDLHPTVREYIGNIEPKEGKLYVLVNALGSGEYYGSNINGDYFEETELSKTAEHSGHRTFLNAGVYRHHKNKDPEKSMGQIKVAEYNPSMRRVELIIELDREKTAAMGHGDLLTSLDAGENPSVSMGCKVKHDVCSICENKSRTRADYCKHASAMMGRVLDDGRKVYVTNPNPRFFDLSFVAIGADRTSYAMNKLASANGELSVDAAKTAGLTDPSLRSLTKKAWKQKVSDILKRIPGTAESVDSVARREPSLGPRTIRIMASRPMSSGLTTASSLGIVLKPQEFQKIILIKLGHEKLAAELEAAGKVFAPVSEVDKSISFGDPAHYDKDIRNELLPVLEDRSAFEPFVSQRFITKMGSASDSNDIHYVSNELLDSISAGYNGYRVNVMEKISEISEKISVKDTDIMNYLGESRLEDQFVLGHKTAGIPPAALGVVGFGSLAYLYGAYVKEKRRVGMPLSTVDKFVEAHPNFSAAMAFGLARLGTTLHKSGKLEGGTTSLLAKIT